MKRGPRRRGDEQEHFWRHVNKTETCWLWTGANSRVGYGKFKPYGKPTQLAHRLAYEWQHGPIPEGLVLDHLCRTPACVRPDHLEAVTGFVNTWERGLGEKHLTWRTDVCKRGHAYTPENTSRSPSTGKRICKKCRTLRQRGYNAAKRDQVTSSPQEKESARHCSHSHDE